MQKLHSTKFNSDENADFKKVLSTIKRYKLSILFTVLLFILGGALVSYFSAPVYETYSSVEVTNDELDLSLDSMVRRGGISDDITLIDTQVEIIKSRSLIEKAMEKVNYQTQYFTSKNYKTIELYNSYPFEVSEIKVKNSLFYNTMFEVEPVDKNSFILRTTDTLLNKIIKSAFSLIGNKVEGIKYERKHNFSERIDNDMFSIVIKKKDDFRNRVCSFKILDKDDAIKAISSKLSVFSVARNGSIIKMVYQDNVAKRAKDFLDNLVNIYLDQSIHQKTAQASNALSFIDDQLKQVSKKLQDSAIKIENFKEENSLIDIGVESDVTLRKLSELQTQLSDVSVEENTFKTLYDEFKKGNHSAISSLTTEYPILATLLDGLQTTKTEKVELLVDYTQKHPDVIKVTNEIEDIEITIENTIESIYEKIKERKKSIEDTLYTHETVLFRLPEKERELADLQRKHSVNEKTYSYLLEKQAEMSINKASTVSSNRILDNAILERQPIEPVKSMIMASSGILGLIVALIISFMRDYFDNTIKSKEDLVALSSIPFFGSVPFVKDRALTEKLFVLDEKESPASESLRALRTNLEFVNSPNESKVIIVTSTIPSEGKTTVAANLSGIFGMSEKKCIVLSLDLRRPQLHKRFGLTNKIGMSTVLSKRNELKEAVWEHKKIPNLDIITSGPIPPNPSELVQSERMQEILEELRKEYDYIIVDSPPVGSVTDPLILMKHADISLIVFKSEFSEKDHLKSLNELVSNYNIENVGLVLNGVKTKYMAQSFYKYNYATYK